MALRRFLRRGRPRIPVMPLAALSAVALVAIGVSAGIVLQRGLPDVSAVYRPPAETTRILRTRRESRRQPPAIASVDLHCPRKRAGPQHTVHDRGYDHAGHEGHDRDRIA